MDLTKEELIKKLEDVTRIYENLKHNKKCPINSKSKPLMEFLEELELEKLKLRQVVWWRRAWEK